MHKIRVKVESDGFMPSLDFLKPHAKLYRMRLFCFCLPSDYYVYQSAGHNYKFIYGSEILEASNQYFSIVINQIYNTLKKCYDSLGTINNLNYLKKFYPNLVNGFMEWLNNFSKTGNREGLKNRVLFDIEKPRDYYFAIVLYISGMTALPRM